MNVNTLIARHRRWLLALFWLALPAGIILGTARGKLWEQRSAANARGERAQLVAKRSAALPVRITTAAPAQSGGSYNICPSVIPGGGGASAGGGNAVNGSVGQSGVGQSSGGSYAIAGGFWPGTSATPCPTLTLTPAVLPNGNPGVAYPSQIFTAQNGSAPYTFNQSGTLPPGLTFTPATALLAGTPTTPGTYNFSLTATDANQCAGSQSYTVTINCPAIMVNPLTLPNGNLGQAYSQTLTATGGTSLYSFAVTLGALLNGLTLAAGGALTGTPVVAGTFNLTVTATDANNCTGVRAYTLTISNCPAISVNPATLPNGTVSTAYSQNLSAVGGTGPYTFSVSTGVLPAGLTLSTAGVLSGVPTVANSFNFTVQALDANNCTGTRAYSITIGTGLQFFPLARPVRLLDTRAGFTGCFAPNAPIAGGTVRTQLAAGQTCDGVLIPATAKALTGHITTVQSNGGFLTLFPSDAAQPLVASTNYSPDEIVNNVFTVGLGAGDGAFKIFAHATTEVVVDVTGYYAPPGPANPGGLYFHPLPKPVRLLETRAGETGCFTSGAPLPGGFDFTQQARGVCQGETIPANAQAISGNATTVNPQAPGFLTLFPSNVNRPLAASSNFGAGQIVNGPFTVVMGADGAFKVFPSATTDLVVDVLGYYSPDANDINGAGLLFSPLAKPVRLLETRAGFTGCFTPGVPLVGGAEFTQPARGFCQGETIPATALGVIGNATVVNHGAGFLTLWPANVARPLVATSNFGAGQIVNRHFVVGLGPVDGACKIFPSAGTDLVVDLTGYFAP